MLHLQALPNAAHAEVVAEEVVQQVIQKAVAEQQAMEAWPKQHLLHQRIQQGLCLRQRANHAAWVGAIWQQY